MPWHFIGRLDTWMQPAQDAAAAEPAVAPGVAVRPDWCVLCVLLIVCPPAGIAWLLASWRRSRADPGQRLAIALVGFHRARSPPTSTVMIRPVPGSAAVIVTRRPSIAETPRASMAHMA